MSREEHNIRFGSLFAGIGGFDLGLERAGMECAWQVEIDPYATRVLEKHWPDVRRWSDVRTFPPEPVDDWRVDLICGGFPCQDISYAGKGAGITGERSGLFFEAVRVVRQLRPRFVLLENVAALLTRGLDVVLGTLAEVGYDAEWHCIPAAAVGAPHIRDRVFVVAYRNGERLEGAEHERKRIGIVQWFGDVCEDVPDPLRPICESGPGGWGIRQGDTESADTEGDGLQRHGTDGEQGSDSRRTQEKLEGLRRRNQWSTEPDVGRVANGVPSRVDRLRCLGNAVVPQVAEWIGRQLMRKIQTERTG